VANASYGTTSEIDFVPPSEVDLDDVSPKQIVSVSTALIPSSSTTDANRALMGANMQKAGCAARRRPGESVYASERECGTSHGGRGAMPPAMR